MSDWTPVPRGVPLLHLSSHCMWTTCQSLYNVGQRYFLMTANPTDLSALCLTWHLCRRTEDLKGALQWADGQQVTPVVQPWKVQGTPHQQTQPVPHILEGKYNCHRVRSWVRPWCCHRCSAWNPEAVCYSCKESNRVPISDTDTDNSFYKRTPVETSQAARNLQDPAQHALPWGHQWLE